MLLEPGDAVRPTALLTTLLLLPLLAGVVPMARGEDEIHPDDAALVTRVKAVLPPAGTIADFARALGTEAEDTRDLGFGGTWRRFSLYAETLTLWVDVLGHGPDVAAVRVRSLGGSDALRRLMRDTWGDAVAIRPDGVDARFEVRPVFGLYGAAIAKALGTSASVTIPEADREAAALLADPLSDLTFGDVCNEDGSPPRGREAVDSLRLRASVVTLDVVLRGPNPEGRLYAAEALLLLQQEGVRLTESLETAVHEVLALEIPIQACGGCLHYEQPAALLVHEGRLVGAVAGSLVERIHEDGRWVDVGKVIVYWDGTYVWRRRAPASEAGAEPSWRRGRIPEALSDRLYHTLRTGTGLQVHLGTPIYVLHLEDTMTKPPPGIGELHTHLLGTLPPEGD